MINIIDAICDDNIFKPFFKGTSWVRWLVFLKALFAIPMDDAIARRDALIRSAARRLTGYQRRLFQAEVATELCGGDPRQAERRFGWGRDTVATGLHERRSGLRCRENFAARGRKRSEDKDPQLAADIRAIVEPHATPIPN